jgi:YegS/Rv2252/BmrU family lipid kinase
MPSEHGRELGQAGTVSAVTHDLARLGRRLIAPVVVVTALLVGAGLLLDAVPDPVWPYPLTGSRRVVARTVEALGAVSVVVAPAALVAVWMRVGYRRWRESVFLLTAVGVAAIALAVASVVVPGRTYPAVASGLALATYGGIAVVLRRRLDTVTRRQLGAATCAVVPAVVAASQLGLGIHRPAEILAGLLAGAAAVALSTRLVLMGGGFEERVRGEPAADAKRAAVIVNPTKVADMAEQRRAVCAYLAAEGWAPPLWLETRLDDTGRGLAAGAAASGVDVVFACGGDGTLMAVLTGLAGTGVPMAILPAGTGNLLARNLELPQDRDACLRIGLHGDDRKIDVGFVDGAHRFAVMAGMGLDAAAIADVPVKLKARIGWPAYAISAIRHLFDRRMNVTLTIDDQAPQSFRARTVMIGNVGRLQAGLRLMPDALPDDGLLDIVVLVPKSIAGWARLALHVVARRPGPNPRMKHFRARRIHIRTERAYPRQLDGDLLEPAASMSVEVEPRALLVRVPSRPVVDAD